MPKILEAESNSPQMKDGLAIGVIGGRGHVSTNGDGEGQMGAVDWLALGWALVLLEQATLSSSSCDGPCAVAVVVAVPSLELAHARSGS